MTSCRFFSLDARFAHWNGTVEHVPQLGPPLPCAGGQDDGSLNELHRMSRRACVTFETYVGAMSHTLGFVIGGLGACSGAHMLRC